MALPEVTLPRGLPFFLAADHGFTLESAYAKIPRPNALTRSRRLFTRSVRIQSVAMVLEADEAQAFVEWFDDDLDAGARPFSAQIAAPDGSPLWYGCEWVEPYQATAMARGRWRIEGRVRLSGEPPTVDGPVRSAFRAEVFVPLTGFARVTAAKVFAAEVSVPLTGSVEPPEVRDLAAEITVGLS